MDKKSNRRKRRGTGGIRKKNNNYEGTFIIHRKNGTKITKSFTRKTINEIEDIQANLRLLGLVDNDIETIDINKFTNEITCIYKGKKTNSVKVDKNILVKDYVDYFLFEHRKNGIRGRKIEDTTFNTYTDKGKYIKEYLGEKKVIDLTFDDIEDFINKLHKKTSDTTTRQTRDIVTSMITFAKKDGIIKENFLQGDSIHLKECKGRKEKKIIEEDDIEIFTEYCLQKKYYDLIFILNTGIRASELAGITWNNINWEEQTVTIDKQYMRIKKQTIDNNIINKTSCKEFKDLKTKSSYRTISIKGLIGILKEHKERQKLLAEKKNIQFKEDDWVFTTKTYKGYVADYISDKFRKVMESIKIKNYKELTVHDLRHTYCSTGIKSGIRLEEMKKILGHSNIWGYM